MTTKKPLRAKLASSVSRGAAALSRATGRGDGAVIGGKIGLMIDPNLLANLAAGREIALISGTNGKTTTTRLTTAALGVAGAVATNSFGANMPTGHTSALARAGETPYAVLEVDEHYLPEVLRATEPKVVALLNLSRDQLDRAKEVAMMAQLWRDTLTAHPVHVVANADDPMITWAAQAAVAAGAGVTWVAAGQRWHDDSWVCPECGAHIERAGIAAGSDPHQDDELAIAPATGPSSPTGAGTATGLASPTGPDATTGLPNPTGPDATTGLPSPTGADTATGLPSPTGPDAATGLPNPTGPDAGTGPAAGPAPDSGPATADSPAPPGAGQLAVGDPAPSTAPAPDGRPDEPTRSLPVAGVDVEIIDMEATVTTVVTTTPAETVTTTVVESTVMVDVLEPATPPTDADTVVDEPTVLLRTVTTAGPTPPTDAAGPGPVTSPPPAILAGSIAGSTTAPTLGLVAPPTTSTLPSEAAAPAAGDPAPAAVAPTTVVADWWCTGCSLRRPSPQWYVDGDDVVSPDGRRHTVHLALPGRVNRANAATALAVAAEFGVDPARAAPRLAEVASIAGRYAQVERDGRAIRLLLAKNPAGWLEAFDMAEDAPTLLSINSRDPDGLDTSWLFDVDFSPLAGRQVLITGERAFDLAVRLEVNEVPFVYVKTFAQAVAAVPPGRLEVIANYTAFQDIRAELDRVN